jgi:hypothetical protein
VRDGGDAWSGPYQRLVMLVRVTVAKTAGAGHAEGSLGVVWLHVCGAQRAPRERVESIKTAYPTARGCSVAEPLQLQRGRAVRRQRRGRPMPRLTRPCS